MPRVTVATSNTLRYPQGGHVWVYLNWALSFAARGWDVTWLDMLESDAEREGLAARVAHLKAMLSPFGIGEIAVIDADGRVPDEVSGEPAEGDLLFNLRYNLPEALRTRFRRRVLVDTDPGMVQYAMRHGRMSPGRHDAYFTVGNGTFADAAGDFLATGVCWHPTSPAVALDHWPRTPIPADAAWTTVSHWYMDVWMVTPDGTAYENDKRTAFTPLLHLPRAVAGAKFALALNLNGDPDERQRLTSLGWQIVEAHDVTRTLGGYGDFIRGSLGEFSACKPSYRRQQTGWVSDRTACYLASGRPCVVEDTGDRPGLDADAGLLRFTTPDEAVARVTDVMSDPGLHAKAARDLAERHFDGRLCVDRVLDVVEA